MKRVGCRMPKAVFLAITLLCTVWLAPLRLKAQTPAPAPPMGWNSWDSYGLALDEDKFKANATVLASLKQYGWEYAVIDWGWYIANPEGQTLEQMHYLWDADGLLIPVASRFPSAANGAGFKPLADWAHSRQLKFGIHIMRGIPRQVVAANIPIAGTSFHATDAADTTSPCPWNQGNYGIKDNAAGQAYYDSMLKLYSTWGLDFLKVDCISDNPYRPTEIRQIAEAIRKSGRSIVLSLSPGPTDVSHASEVSRYAQMWRIANDHWDAWTFPHKPGDGGFPVGIREMFEHLAKWNPHVGPGSWPDADMLPEGFLGPSSSSDWGKARQSRYTKDEQRTEFTLWAIARSPLIFGGNLTRLDDFTRSLFTNRTVISINQYASYSRPVDVSSFGSGFRDARVWRAVINAPGVRGYTEYVAFFNLSTEPRTLRATWKDLGFDGAEHSARSIWDYSTIKKSNEITVSLAAHGSALFELH